MIEQAIQAFYEISIAKALLVFAVTTLSDVFWAIYIRRVSDRKMLSAASISSFIVLFAGFAAIEYVGNNWYLVPAMLGAFVGTFFTLKIDGRKECIQEPNHHQI